MIKKGKSRSQVSVTTINNIQVQEIDVLPLDELTVKIQSLRVMDETPKSFMVKVTFYDQLILNGVIKSITSRAVVEDKTVISGKMLYDPSDYEKMCLMVDNPLCVQIQPLLRMDLNVNSGNVVESVRRVSSGVRESHASRGSRGSRGSQGSHGSYGNHGVSPRVMTPPKEKNMDISGCNIDILSLFMDEDTMRVKKRLEPLIKPSILLCKSWENLPIISIRLKMKRDRQNEQHHKVLREANFMKMTLVAAYNMLVPHYDEYIYTAASKLPSQNATDLGLVLFNQGSRVPKQFNSMKFKPQWESLRVGDENFVQGDDKFECNLGDIQNDDEIPLERYVNNTKNTTVWGSFHRTLMVENADVWLWKHIRRYHWPLEVHIYGETQGYSFMGFLNLFKLLFPGENTVCIAVPLLWINAEAMQQMCGCDLLLTPNEKASSIVNTQKTTGSLSQGTSSNDAGSLIRTTGSDDNNAFVVVEIKLARPLKKAVIPPLISSDEINNMLIEMEQTGSNKRYCSGRGQQDRDWQTTVRNAAASLRKVPYHGMTEFCNFNRQLSETRTRVELVTSCWQDAAIYINNNFVIQDFLQSDNTFEEMLMIAHTCLMRSACATLVGVDNWQIDSTLRAARHARQMQDIPHAMELYLQLVAKKPRDANCWRELSTCLKDIDRDWAKVCISKAVALDPRHPLTLLSKGCMLFEEDPAQAEPFFVALLALFPFWCTGWIITSAYYIKRELYYMADEVVRYNRKTFKRGMMEDFGSPRSWERELGDWWDYTPLLPGMSPYYDAADLLLRLRAISLAEVCVSVALCEAGETAAYFHLVALCCCLRGNLTDALCHINTGIEKYGEITYLRSLEAECHHKQNNLPAAKASVEKAGSCLGGYITLLSIPYREQQRARTTLVDLVRRQPSAYAWIAFADDWLMRDAAGIGSDGDGMGDQVTAKTCAAFCAIQALKLDRRASRAWALLADLVKPNVRRQYYLEIARTCGYMAESDENLDINEESEMSICCRLGTALRECRCELCEIMPF